VKITDEMLKSGNEALKKVFEDAAKACDTPPTIETLKADDYVGPNVQEIYNHILGFSSAVMAACIQEDIL
jgi:hypothetical protein